MATDGWYCEVKGEVLGPMPPSEMMLRIRLGEVGFHTRVRKNDSRWVSAHEVNGLFESATKVKEIFRCNYCGSGVCRPPSACNNCGQKIDRVTELMKITATDADRKAAAKLPASTGSTAAPAAAPTSPKPKTPASPPQKVSQKEPRNEPKSDEEKNNKESGWRRFFKRS